ncbi:MAG: hypothetical protein J1D88_05460 [Treponema sp.]|nr:hypothetical protein [Treponema sp.]
MQRAYISALLELAEKDNRVFHILADSGTGFDELFRRNFPDRMLNFGIAEENMVGAAAGMATAGKIPFVYTAGAFLAYRAFEYIRDDVCFQNLNVKIVGMGSGLAWGSLGPTHHTTEDIAVLRSLPNLMILSPSTPRQVAECVKVAYDHIGPVYIRIGMNDETEFFEETYELPRCGLDIMHDTECASVDYVLFTTGAILEESVEAVQILSANGANTKLVNVPVIKPFASKYAAEIIRTAKAVFTVEEHSLCGGLGSILCECVAENAFAVPVKRIGLADAFAAGYGTQSMVRKQNKLDSKSIAETISAFIGGMSQ